MKADAVSRVFIWRARPVPVSAYILRKTIARAERTKAEKGDGK